MQPAEARTRCYRPLRGETSKKPKLLIRLCDLTCLQPLQGRGLGTSRKAELRARKHRHSCERPTKTRPLCAFQTEGLTSMSFASGLHTHNIDGRPSTLKCLNLCTNNFCFGPPNLALFIRTSLDSPSTGYTGHISPAGAFASHSTSD